MIPHAAAFLLLISQVYGQTPALPPPAPAPPDVDVALRTRISKFYQTQIDGKPRLAEPLVAEDSKDVFYAMNKPRFLSFSIERIDYSDNFTRAKASVMVKMYVPLAFLGKEPMNLAIPSLWKIEYGEWCWYIDPDSLKSSPFGKMNPATPEPSNTPVSAPEMKGGPTVEDLWQKVKADKPVVILHTATPTEEQVSITNHMPGPVTIDVRFPPAPGLEVVADRREIAANEKAIIRFRYKPGSGKIPTGSVVGRVAVEPIHSLITLRVVFE